MVQLIAKTHELSLYCRPIMAGKADLSDNNNWIFVMPGDQYFVLGKHDIYLKQYKPGELLDILLRPTNDDYYWWHTNSTIAVQCLGSKLKHMIATPVEVLGFAGMTWGAAKLAVALKLMSLWFVFPLFLVVALATTTGLGLAIKWSITPFLRESHAMLMACMLYCRVTRGYIIHEKEINALYREALYTGKLSGYVLLPMTGVGSPVWINRHQFAAMEKSEI